MTPWDLILRGLRWRWVATVLNGLGVALGVCVVCVVLLVQSDLRQRFEAPGRDYGLVVGAPGSAQQLVLNAVFHQGESPGVIPRSTVRELAEHRSTALAVPYAVGDSFRGHRVVATTEAFFDERFPHPAASRPKDKLAVGRSFGPPAAGVREAVIGVGVRDAIGVRVGDKVELSHGVEDGAMAHEHETLWEVVGVLEETGTALDEVVLIHLDTFLAMDEHAGGTPGVSAVLLFPRRGVHTATLLGELRQRSDLQVAHVATEVRRLLSLVGRLDALFLWVAWLVSIVSITSIFASSYLSTHARKGQFALLRALGLPRRTIVAMSVAEAAVLTLGGAVLGALLAHGLLWIGGGRIEHAVGFGPDPARLVWGEGLAVLAVVAAGACAGLMPGLRAFGDDVATLLSEVE
ncbi:MAG: ABC transporter permease [Myxococcota bacterium]